MKSLYSYMLVAAYVMSLISRVIVLYEPQPEKMSLAEYEARREVLMSRYKEMYPNEDKIESEANNEVTEVYYEDITEEYTPEYVPDVAEAPASDMTYLGTYDLTAYIWTGDPCADGVYPSTGYTVACNDPTLWHRWVYIEGFGTYYVHDVGGMPSYNIIDVYVGDYDTAIQFGRQSANVYLIN